MSSGHAGYVSGDGYSGYHGYAGAGQQAYTVRIPPHVPVPIHVSPSSVFPFGVLFLVDFCVLLPVLFAQDGFLGYEFAMMHVENRFEQ